MFVHCFIGAMMTLITIYQFDLRLCTYISADGTKAGELVVMNQTNNVDAAESDITTTYIFFILLIYYIRGKSNFRFSPVVT